MDLSLYKDESQIEKKTSGKRKAKDRADSGKLSPAAKKRKVTATKTRETPTARAIKSNVGGSKASNAGSKSAKVSQNYNRNRKKMDLNWKKYMCIFNG